MQEESSEEFKESVCRNIGSSLAQVQRDVETLRQWLNTQQHLPQYPCDNMLATYLIACKNDMEKAKMKIDNLFTVRQRMPDLFSDRDPTTQRVRDVAEELPYFSLPKLTPDGCRVVLGYIATGDPDKYDILAFAKRAVASDDIRMNKEPYINGLYFVFDCNNLSMGHVVRVSPRIVQHLLQCVQDASPIRVKGLIFFNAPSIFNLILTIVKPFMKNKLVSRLHVHTEGPEVLEKYFPQSMMPKDFGGEEDSSKILNAAWQDYIEEHRDWLLNEGSLLTDETKRPNDKSTKKKNKEILPETYRTLNID